VMLEVAGLYMLRVSCDQRHVFTFFILEVDLPAVEELWSWMNICELRILKWPLQLATDHILETVVGDDVMVRALVLDGDGFLHQTAFLELVTVNKRSAKAALLVWSKTLGKIGIHLACGLCISGKCTVK
jgi:hypothetical protein